MMMVAAISEATSTDPKNPRRPPLLPSSDRPINNGVGPPKKPKSRQISSRYMSPSPSPSPSNSSLSSSNSSSSSSSRRYPSPLISRNSTPNTPARRSASVDRRRPMVCRPLSPDLGNAGEPTASTKLLVTSIRSFSVSFQGETFSLPISKTKVQTPSPNLRKNTPERRSNSSINSNSISTPLKGKVDGGGDQLENPNPRLIEQQRWPARIRRGNSLTKSLECHGENNSKLVGSGNEIMALKQSMTDEGIRASIDARLNLDLGNAELLEAIQQAPSENCSVNDSSLPSDLTASDSDSVSSGSTSGVQECAGLPPTQSGSRGNAVPARFWPKWDPGSPFLTSPGSKMIVPPKFNQPKKFPCDSSSSLSSPRKMSSPLRAGTRPASPSKLTPTMLSLPSRGMVSPSRVRGAVASTISSSFSETPSVLSFAVDVRRGKVGEHRIVDAHMLRLLYNRQLVWRFVNAKTEAVMTVQKHNAEKNLWNAWITISNLRDSVTKKRHRLQLLRQKLKLASILKGQMKSVEDWASLDKDHSVSLLGAIGALKASTLRLPVIGGAMADVRSIKDAISSAFDVTQAMTSSICSSLLKVEEVNSLLNEVAKETAKERALLEQCKHLLSMLAAMQVKDGSLRTHMLQHKRVPLT
ncbi:hypothetical protein LguiA_027330 [Lonicera macranthoides]